MTFPVKRFCLRFYKPNNDASREARGFFRVKIRKNHRISRGFVLCFFLTMDTIKPLRTSDHVDVHHEHDVDEGRIDKPRAKQEFFHVST